MGFTMVPNTAIDRMREISAGALKLYLYLLRCRNQGTGQCNPSAAKCAEAIGVLPRHIFKLRRELATTGWVEFDQGAATVLIDLDSVENDTLSKMTPPSVKNDTDTLSKMTPPSVINAPTCKEEQYERTIGGNNTNRTREGADAPHARKTTHSNPQSKDADTANQPVADNSSPGGKSAGRKRKGPANRPAKSPFHSHPAVVAYRDTLGYKTINSVQAELIAQATGVELATPPDTWVQFLKELAATGNRHTHNIQVMVAAFMHYQSGARLSEALDLAWTQHKGEIPQGGQGNGKSSTRKSAGENLRESIEWTLS